MDPAIAEITAAPIRAFPTDIAALAAATRKRKRAAASFCRWAIRHDLLDTNLMDKIDTIGLPMTPPRCVRRCRQGAQLDLQPQSAHDVSLERR